MVDALIFSKDRPAQLDLLLRSIDTFADGLYSSVSILVDWSSKFYRDGYEMCFREHTSQRFCLDTDFEHDVRTWLAFSGDYISFLVDDDVFYRPVPDGEIVLPLSLRGGDYDYPFSVDGNIYHRDDIVRLLEGILFSDPSQLESQAYYLRERLPFTSVNPCESPCLVGVPLNRVSETSGMPHMNLHQYDLNERYLAGERLQIPVKPDHVDWYTHEQIAPVWATRVTA